MDDMQKQLRQIEKRLDRAARFGSIKHKEIKKANREAAKQYVPVQRSLIKNFKEDIEIRPGLVVTRGQLKKSIGVWFPKGSNTAIAGPRANRAGKTKLKRKVRDTADGWFAHIVEMGARPAQMKKGGKQGGPGVRLQTPNTGVLTRGLQLAQPKVKSKQISLYRSEFKRYMK